MSRADCSVEKSASWSPYFWPQSVPIFLLIATT